MNMIIKSIDERSRLEAQVYNTNKDFIYLKSCPKEVFYHYRNKVMQSVSEYNRLRACFDNYQDKKTLDNDNKIASIIKNLNKSGRF